MHIRGRDVEGRTFDLSIEAGRWAEPDGSEIFDLGRFACLPGLIDAHAHLSGEDLDLISADSAGIFARARTAVESGVVVCLDKGWDDELVLEMVSYGVLTEPRIQAAGRMLRSPGGYWGSFGRVVTDEMLPEVVEAIAPARPWVKIVGDWPRKGQGALPNFSEQSLAAAVTAAHAGGAKVAVHTMAPGVASAAVRAGVDSIEHGLFLDSEDLEILAARGGMWVPTILRMEEVLANMKAGSSGAELIGRGLENVRTLLPLAADIGLTVMAGSDLAISSAQIGREVAALVRLGLPAATAVAGATECGAHAVGMEMGLNPGAPADLVAYEGDPVAKPGLLEHPVVVIASGVLVRDRR